jgi:N utilization substance protein A
LDIDELIAQLLAAEGFTTIEEIATVDLEDLTTIEGFDEEISQELQNRAITYLEDRNTHLTEEAYKAGVQEDLATLEGMEPIILAKLVENGIKTRDDFADLSGDELVDLLGRDMITQDQANALIMKAREHWFQN